MALEVIGAGFGRTGTLSLKHALERLGAGPCYHMVAVREHPHHDELWRRAGRGDAVDWEALFAGYRSAVDWPSCNFWEQQMAAFPDAKVILTVRDSQRWYESIMQTIYAVSRAPLEQDTPERRAHRAMVLEVVWHGLFDDRMDDREHVVAVYEAHNRRVRDTVPAGRFLQLDPREGWPPLCAFLGCDVPDEPFPHVNSTSDFLARDPGSARSAAVARDVER